MANVGPVEVYVERGPHDPAGTPTALPDRYANWEEMRSLSPAIQRELVELATRALPDMRRVPRDPLPERLPAEMDGWKRAIGTINRSGESWLYTSVVGWACLMFGVTGLFGCGAALMMKQRGQFVVASNSELAVGTLFSLGVLAAAMWYTFFRIRRFASTIWVFEEGMLCMVGRRVEATRWEDIRDLKVSREFGIPWFVIESAEGLFLEIAPDQSPEIMPLMELIELRISASQFLPRLAELVAGAHLTLGVMAFEHAGIRTGKVLFAWPNVIRVIADRQLLFIDLRNRSKWFEVPYSSVSFVLVAMAIANVLIAEHTRLPKTDA